ncbi:MAG: asparagine--tRNA ligase [FCB group bacterium]|nr:asparagine--tRNA ligase [FCB group bacterium]
MTDTTIAKLSDFVGEEVRLSGWLYNKRSGGKIKFLQVRDGTGTVQAVMVKNELPEEVFALYGELTQESSLIVTGLVREEPRSPSGYEMSVTGIEPVQIADPYPITKKEHGVEFLHNNRHLWLRSSRQYAIMHIRNQVIWAIREFFYNRDFVLIDSPLLTGSIGEEASTLFETEYFKLGKAYLAQTGQLYIEAACMSLRNVFCFGPTFRAEKSLTRRHLTEFWMIEAEMAYCDNEGNMKNQEEMLSHVAQSVVKNCRSHLETLERDISKLEGITPPFPRLDYGEAIKILQEKGSDVKWGDDLGAEDETILSNMHDKPVFIVNYPKHAKAFYMKENPDNPETVLCSDLLGPEGYGEIIGGSQREDDHDKLLARIREEKLPEKAYDWYLDLRKYGSVPHSGYGLGIERTVTWMCGIHHIREAIPFPRLMTRLTP